MKPDWDKLMNKFANDDKLLVADVDCTAGGKSLCSKQGVRGYPTVMYGAPTSMSKYTGGRDFEAETDKHGNP